MYKGNKISVVIPCYNEEKGIEKTIRKIPEVVDEIVVCDNNSSDNTKVVAMKAGARVVGEKKRGYGFALRKAIESARGDITVTMDGDATYPAEDIESLVKYLVDNKLDFISGNRLPLCTRESMHLTNILGIKFLNWIAYLLFGKMFNDILSGMWVFRSDKYRELKLVSYDWNLSEEIKIEAANKLDFAEKHINHHKRVGDTKLLKWRVGMENLIFLFWKRFNPNAVFPLWLKLAQ
jgi:glycosyltransferase involved in cell wall biosynthesis